METLKVLLGEAEHVLFLKEHTARREDVKYPAKRTLFVANIPQFITVRAMGMN